MKKSNLKSTMGLALMSLFLIAFAPTDSFAQKDNHKNNSKKEKVTSPVKHYNKQPRRGAQVTAIPKNTKEVTHRNLNYHYHDGIFYRPVKGSYVVVAPPIGIRVSVLPPNPFRVIISGHSYYYYYGTYYVPAANGGYEVVGAPVGARIDALPDGYEVFELDGMVFYRLDETYYKAVLEPNGNVVYEVVRV